jgi:DNA (cytosine-5)-methyltransferase 1
MAFVMENVVGMVTRHKSTLDELIQSYTDIGYNVNFKVLDASKFGTPQTRERLFIVGIRDDLDFYFKFPSGTHKTITVREALADLKDPINVNPRDRVLGEIPNHIATWTNPNPERILDLHLTTRPNQWIGTRRLEWDKPAYTITAHIAKDGREFLHPSENRRITQREALRLMGVPDSYVIPAHLPLKHQYMLIGNGVAYQVAKALSDSIKEQLECCLDTSSIEPQMVEYRIDEQLSFDDLLFI